MKALRIHVHGSVQGVGFRYFTQRQASEHGIKGWVRNCADGTVEICAQGSDTDLQHFLQLVEKGPAYASVSRLDVEDVKNPEAFKDFRVTF
jgi:acylphosphatase